MRDPDEIRQAVNRPAAEMDRALKAETVIAGAALAGLGRYTRKADAIAAFAARERHGVEVVVAPVARGG